MTGGDGTQAPEPPQSFGDALTGPDGEARTAPDRSQTYGIAPAGPVEPDPEMVRSMVDAALANERTQPQVSADDLPAEGAATDAVTDEPAEEQPERPRDRAPLLPAMLRRRRPRPARAGGGFALRRPSNGSAGIVLALVLLVVFCVLAIQFVVSFVESITGIFS